MYFDSKFHDFFQENSDGNVSCEDTEPKSELGTNLKNDLKRTNYLKIYKEYFSIDQK